MLKTSVLGFNPYTETSKQGEGRSESAGSLCQGVSSILDLIVMCSTAAL